MRLPESELYPWVNSILQAVGLRPTDAVMVTDIFMRASRRELGHHDLHDLPGRLQQLQSRAINPTPSFTPLRDEPGVYVFDGDGGLGELCCGHACRQAIERAQQTGIGLASVRHSNHFLAGYPYAQIGAEQNCMLLVYTNTDPSMTGPGGSEAVIGNNPIGFGAPGSTDTAPMLLDTAMAYSSIGNLKALQQGNHRIPDYWALDQERRPTTDPGAALAGWRVRPIGEHKGFGLALMHEVLTGVLSGGETTTGIASPGGLNTHSQTVIAIAAPDTPRGLLQLSRQLQEHNLRLPGAAAAERELQSRHEGIGLQPQGISALVEWSRQLGVALPNSVQDSPD
ncbi:Ldh family oxidoreductase [Spirochaeta africana]|uniref:Malate/lactate dehydrogenase n=1 Tax=Spirochaeta africana (strain ATCC 700263 / DSM 8902 / Z-7692) TaxID=889378 RepID=H9UFU3_SPIAZ|nr:Ldh family oxidoreductase [Spirochaeta africana]AFG36386.1 malate/lactate dehydrogenase [Spirochaeta africana DSM 8902]